MVHQTVDHAVATVTVTVAPARSPAVVKSHRRRATSTAARLLLRSLVNIAAQLLLRSLASTAARLLLLNLVNVATMTRWHHPPHHPLHHLTNAATQTSWNVTAETAAAASSRRMTSCVREEEREKEIERGREEIVRGVEMATTSVAVHGAKLDTSLCKFRICMYVYICSPSAALSMSMLCRLSVEYLLRSSHYRECKLATLC